MAYLLVVLVDDDRLLDLLVGLERLLLLLEREVREARLVGRVPATQRASGEPRVERRGARRAESRAPLGDGDGCCGDGPGFGPGDGGEGEGATGGAGAGAFRLPLS